MEAGTFPENRLTNDRCRYFIGIRRGTATKIEHYYSQNIHYASQRVAERKFRLQLFPLAINNRRSG